MATALLAALSLLALCLGAAADLPLLTLLALVTTTTIALARRLPVDLALPAAVLLLLAVATGTGTVAGLAGINLLGHPWVLLGVEVVLAALVLHAVWSRPSSPHQSPTGRQLLAYAPAALAAAVGLLQGLGTVRSWAVLGTDLAEHTVLLGQVQESGRLDYAAQAYPRALHMLLAFTQGPRTPEVRSTDLLGQDLHLMAAVVWLTLALVLCAAVAVTTRTAMSMGIKDSSAWAAATLVSWLLLTSTGLQISFVHLGAAPSLLAVVALWSVPATALDRPGRPGLVALAALGAVGLLAHLWQALILGPAVAAVVCGVWWVRTRRGGVSTRQAALAALGGGLWLLVAVPPLLGVQQAGGVSIAAIAGEMSDVPVIAGAAALIGLAVGLATLPRITAVAWAATALGLMGAVGVLLSGAGWSLHAYYPMKGLWFVVLFLAPFAGIVAAVGASWLLSRAWTRLGSFAGTRRFTRVGLVAAASLLVLALTGPGLVGNSSVLRDAAVPSSSDGLISRRLALATTLPAEQAGAIVVPSALALHHAAVQYGAYITSKLLRFQSGQPTSYGNPEQVCADVKKVAGARRAVVVTDLPPAVLHAVMARQGCGDVEVVQAAGGDPVLVQRVIAELRQSGERR